MTRRIWRLWRRQQAARRLVGQLGLGIRLRLYPSEVQSTGCLEREAIRADLQRSCRCLWPGLILFSARRGEPHGIGSSRQPSRKLKDWPSGIARRSTMRRGSDRSGSSSRNRHGRDGAERNRVRAGLGHLFCPQPFVGQPLHRNSYNSS